MRLRLEFTTEPFDLDESPPHAVVAREVVRAAGLEGVEVGPFGNTAEGTPEAVFSCVDALLRQALAAGATRISLQVNAVEAKPDQETEQDAEPAGERAADGGFPI
ncbi:thiamine-binding protein [Streptomyces sp. NBRC 109706]|uniref:thiamine-binding protein n=1 Tax=Streptomyces sp. NBRC 109706 TaxID=1550035 RepID=UPI000AA34472|nr:thiamine-binding protein [Streptomyces sp. NBRC 109706]